MNQLFIWQQVIWQRLMRHREFQCHALLLKGRKGIGKFTFARLLAKSLLCFNPGINNLACGKCASCQWFEQSSHPNFAMILPESLSEILGDNVGSVENAVDEDPGQPMIGGKTKKKPGQQISIDRIRGMNNLVYMTGHQQGFKILLIYPAEAMNNAAANALLKKLEEPPERVLFILVSHQPRRLLATITSRCQQINMPIPDAETAVEWLKQQQRGESADSQNPLALLALSGFAPLSALSFQMHIKQHQQFIETISRLSQFDPLALAESLQEQDLSMTIDWLQKWCYDLASYHATGKIRYHPHLDAHVQTVCKQISPQASLAYMHFLNDRQALSGHPVNGRLFLEDILINYGKLVSKRLF